MSYTGILSNPIQQAFLAVLLIAAGFSTGYTVSEQEQPVTVSEQLQDFDQFSEKAQEVNNMMQATLSNPTEERLRMTNNKLKINYANWERREYGDNKELFHEYRLACQDVIDTMQAGKQADTTEMYRLYYMLVPEEQTQKQNLNINSPFLWLAGIPSI